MKSERLFTTREVAEMWNVSPSTIKRWADSGDLKCRRTPGGHRKFCVRELSEFQDKQGFEATGMLKENDWEDPEIERAVNEKNMGVIHQALMHLALQNQRSKMRVLLERLHIRGLSLCQIYDRVVIPVIDQAAQPEEGQDSVSSGHQRLLQVNLDDAVHHLFPNLTRRKPHQKMALAASLDSPGLLRVNAISRVLEVEGWDVYNVGDHIKFSLLADLVKDEPFELICVTAQRLRKVDKMAKEYGVLYEAAHPYRIPILLCGRAFTKKKYRNRFPDASYVGTHRALRRHAVKR